MPAPRRQGRKEEAPFTGFPPEALEFFRQLAVHNDRPWFLAHKEVYERACRRPMQAMVAALAPRWGPGKVSRINRDLRFARGRPPYKTHIAAGVGGRYVDLSADGVWVGSGIYRPEPPRLQKLRAAIADARTGPQLAKILDRLRAKEYDIGTHETLATAPRGYRPDHPRIALLQMKDVYAGRAFPPAAWLATPAALARIERVMEEVEPLVAWVQKNVPRDEAAAAAHE